MLLPAVIIGNRHEASFLSNIAAGISGRAVVLSPPYAAQTLGIPYFSALVARMQPAAWTILNCGQDPGRALEAWKSGIDAVVLDVPTRLYARLSLLAKDNGKTLFAKPPPAWDLAAATALDSETAHKLKQWLSCKNALRARHP